MTNFGQFIYNTYIDILIERLPDGHPNNKEITNLIKINTFNIIDMPPDLFYKDPLSLIQVFKYKTDSDDFITKYKARLVAKKDLQIIKKEIYVITVVIQTFRTITAIYAAFDLNYTSYDVINIYVNLSL